MNYSPAHPAYSNPYANPYAHPYTIIGADDPNAQPGLLDKTKAWLGQESIQGVKNGYLLGGAALVGLGAYLYLGKGKKSRRRH